MLYEETALTIHNEGYPIQVDTLDNNSHDGINVSLSSVYVKKSCLRTCGICFNFRTFGCDIYSIRQECNKHLNHEYDHCLVTHPMMGDSPLNNQSYLPQVVHPLLRVKKHAKINKLDKNNHSTRYLATTSSSNSFVSSSVDDFDVGCCGLLQSFKHVTLYRDCKDTDMYIISGILCSSNQVFYTDIGEFTAEVQAKDLYPDMVVKSTYHNHRVLKVESYSSPTPTHRFCCIGSVAKISGIVLSCGVIAGTYPRESGKGLLTTQQSVK